MSGTVKERDRKSQLWQASSVEHILMTLSRVSNLKKNTYQ